MSFRCSVPYPSTGSVTHSCQASSPHSQRKAHASPSLSERSKRLTAMRICRLSSFRVAELSLPLSAKGALPGRVDATKHTPVSSRTRPAPRTAASLVVVVALAEVGAGALGQLGRTGSSRFRQLGLLFLRRSRRLLHVVPPQSSRS